MLTAKRVTTLFCMMVLVFIAFPAMAAELSVKENRTKSGVVNVAVPSISGSVGGKNVDNIVNQAVLSYVNSQMKQTLTQQEIETFDSTHKEMHEFSDMLHYNSDLVKYTDKKIVDKNTAGRVTASWYIRNEYEVKSARDTFYSVVLKTKKYTGGSGDVVVWKAMNFDLKDGRLLELKDIFEDKADYATRLQTLIGFQQLGRARLIRHIKGKTVPDPIPVSITGQEEFYVDNHYNLGIILYSKKTGTAPEQAVRETEKQAVALAGAESTAEKEKSEAATAGVESTAEKEKSETTTARAESSAEESKGAAISDGAVKDGLNQAAEKQGSGSFTIEVFDISLNDFADLIRL